MQQTKDLLENLIVSYFTENTKTSQSTNKDYLFIHIDKTNKFLVKTVIPIKTITNYSKATKEQQDNFNNKLELSIKAHISKFSDKIEVWTINFDITH